MSSYSRSFNGAGSVEHSCRVTGSVKDVILEGESKGGVAAVGTAAGCERCSGVSLEYKEVKGDQCRNMGDSLGVLETFGQELAILVTQKQVFHYSLSWFRPMSTSPFLLIDLVSTYV